MQTLLSLLFNSLTLDLCMDVKGDNRDFDAMYDGFFFPDAIFLFVFLCRFGTGRQKAMNELLLKYGHEI